MADLKDVINPKKPLTEREEAAMGAAMGAASAASAPTTNYGRKFSKPFTPAEKAKQAEALEEALRTRK